VLDKHVDIGSRDKLWVLSYNLEGAEYRTVDQFSAYDVGTNDHLSDSSTGENAMPISSDNTQQPIGLIKSLYIDLVKNLKR